MGTKAKPPDYATPAALLSVLAGWRNKLDTGIVHEDVERSELSLSRTISAISRALLMSAGE
jgi:hypothetical protein